MYLTKNDLKKINNKITINEAKIENNETVYIFEEKKDKDNYNDNKENGEIIFNINYQDKNYSINAFKNDIFLDCIKSFNEENEGNDFLFIYNDKIVDKNKSLDELNIQNGDTIKVEKLNK